MPESRNGAGMSEVNPVNDGMFKNLWQDERMLRWIIAGRRLQQSPTSAGHSNRRWSCGSLWQPCYQSRFSKPWSLNVLARSAARQRESQSKLVGITCRESFWWCMPALFRPRCQSWGLKQLPWDCEADQKRWIFRKPPTSQQKFRVLFQCYHLCLINWPVGCCHIPLKGDVRSSPLRVPLDVSENGGSLIASPCSLLCQLQGWEVRLWRNRPPKHTPKQLRNRPRNRPLNLNCAR